MTMKKLVLGAAIAAAMFGAAAQAAIPTIDPANTRVLYISGASAAATFIDKLVTSTNVDATDRICDPASQVYRFRDTGNTEQFAIYCKANNTGAVGVKNPSLPTGAANANLLIYKVNTGGSGTGVTPVAQATPLAFLNITSGCTEKNAGNLSTPADIECTNINNNQIPDMGLSDVDPIQFRGNNAINGVDISATDVAKLTVKAAAALTFGAPVTWDLYRTLQAAQKSTNDLPASCLIGDRTETCMPSLTSAQIASIHAGKWDEWNALKVGNSATAPGLHDWALTQTTAVPAFGGGNVTIADLAPVDAPFLHTCRRDVGSGTQAQSNIIFLGDGCSDAATALPPANATDADFAEGDGVAIIHSNTSTGRVDSCLRDLQNGNDAGSGFTNQWGHRWAIGILSLERANAAYEFVKIDGVAPTLANVVEGKYKDWAENTFQYRNNASSAPLTGDKKTLADAIIKSAGAPSVMADLNGGFVHTFGNGAYLAVPSNFASVNGRFDSARPVVPFSHAVKTGASTFAPTNACRVPTIWGGGAGQL
ncbi:hypothetical protein A1356_13685 [Methylomonas koyamae]|uniref:PBP domain-containing protein n=2 Tax=Methylomonas koyamae TaxID=702114 RepID=A0AA91DC12_9GAMM|nr:hypothetical protein A1356_13685 [Methylomonas koyamae]